LDAGVDLPKTRWLICRTTCGNSADYDTATRRDRTTLCRPEPTSWTRRTNVAIANAVVAPHLRRHGPSRSSIRRNQQPRGRCRHVKLAVLYTHVATLHLALSNPSTCAHAVASASTAAAQSSAAPSRSITASIDTVTWIESGTADPPDAARGRPAPRRSLRARRDRLRVVQTNNITNGHVASTNRLTRHGTSVEKTHPLTAA
jgi:hypothetical protein